MYVQYDQNGTCMILEEKQQFLSMLGLWIYCTDLKISGRLKVPSVSDSAILLEKEF